MALYKLITIDAIGEERETKDIAYSHSIRKLCDICLCSKWNVSDDTNLKRYGRSDNGLTKFFIYEVPFVC
jgi:hypothetical protein